MGWIFFFLKFGPKLAVCLLILSSENFECSVFKNVEFRGLFPIYIHAIELETKIIAKNKREKEEFQVASCGSRRHVCGVHRVITFARVTNTKQLAYSAQGSVSAMQQEASAQDLRGATTRVRHVRQVGVCSTLLNITSAGCQGAFADLAFRQYTEYSRGPERQAFTHKP